VEEDLHPVDVVLAGEMSFKQEIEKESEKNNLTEDPEGLERPVFLRPLFFQ
jgi:hypothetical protein